MTNGVHWPAFPSQRRPRRTAPSQAGAATLAVTVIMLLVVSVLVFHSYAASWLEKRATTNQTWAKQAHAAAEAGLDVALSVLNADTAAPGDPSRATHLTADATQPGRFTIANANLTGSPGAGLAYAVTLALVPGDTAPVARLLLTSTGGSDCANVADVTTCTGQATVRQVVEIEPLFPYQSGSPPSPIRASTPFNTVFGVPQAAMQALTTPVTDGTGFSAATSGLVWHQGDLTLNGTVGRSAIPTPPAIPVLLIVAGNLTIPAGVVVNGFVFVIGDVTCVVCDSPSINGAIAATGANNLTAAQVQLPANAANGELARLGTTAIRFTKVIGTWRDW
jgi:Tfp pilus assembly protein PilX